MLRSGVDLLPGHPYHAPQDVQRRAEVLFTHGWDPHAASPVAGELERQARDGWPAVAAWPHALQAPDELAARRRHHRSR